MNEVTRISEPLMTSFFFIIGLKRNNLRRKLQFHRPPTLMEDFAIAHAYEARLEDNPSCKKPWNHNPTHILSQNTTSSNTSTQNNSNPIPTPNHSLTSNTKPLRYHIFSRRKPYDQNEKKLVCKLCFVKRLRTSHL